MINSNSLLCPRGRYIERAPGLLTAAACSNIDRFVVSAFPFCVLGILVETGEDSFFVPDKIMKKIIYHLSLNPNGHQEEITWSKRKGSFLQICALFLLLCSRSHWCCCHFIWDTLTSTSESWTFLPGFVPRTSSSRARIESTFRAPSPILFSVRLARCKSVFY